MPARLAQLHAEALDLADSEALADQAVHVDVADGDLPPGIPRFEPDVFDDLGGYERQRLPRRRPLGVEVTVPLEPLSGDGLHGLDGPQPRLARGPKMDRLHRHANPRSRRGRARLRG